MTTNHEGPPDVKGFLTAFMRYKFLVQSKTDKTLWYLVDIIQPSCECIHWLRTKLPCEHSDRAIKYREGENR